MLRFEDKHGYGPFRGERRIDLLEDYENDIINSYIAEHVHFPIPYEENLTMSILNEEFNEWTYYFCAYKDEHILKRFCTLQQYQILIKLGFRLYKIEATSIQFGNYQNVFAKESITSKIDVTDEFLLNY